MRYNAAKYEELISSGRVRTWADGFGRWHAKVPASMVAPKLVARGAIWHELRERETKTDGTMPRRPVVELVHEDDTTKTYAEKGD